jgi:hypothetical protein
VATAATMATAAIAAADVTLRERTDA